MNGLARIGWLSVGLWCVVACGCSTSRNSSPRQVPLPPGVSAAAVFNAEPEVVAVADARPYYTDAAKAGGAVTPATPTGEKEPTSATRVREYRANQRREREKKEGVPTPQAKQATEEKKQLDKADEGAEAVRPLADGVREEMRRMMRQLPVESVLGRNIVDLVASMPVTPDPRKTRQKRAELTKQEEQRVPPPTPGDKYDILILAGGPAYGVYQAGILAAWTDSGCRPKFQVVTGVSTGALVACAAFAGSKYDADLKRAYTCSVQKSFVRGDIWKVKAFPPLGIGTDSIATTAPLRKLVHDVLTSPGYFDTVVAEHAAGRRLYVNTTNLDTQRSVVWDMGAIASKGTPEARKLYEDVILSSAAIPPLLTPGHLNVTIDGQKFEEFHVDGGTTRNLFFYPPSDWPGDEEDEKTGYRMLAGARVYAILAGRVYNDPAGTNPTVLGNGFRALSTLNAACQRGEIYRIYAHCMDRDMKFHLSDIPPEYQPLFPSTEFDPEHTSALYQFAYDRFRAGTAWNQRPPERDLSESVARRGNVLSTTPVQEVGNLTPALPPQQRGVPTVRPIPRMMSMMGR